MRLETRRIRVLAIGTAPLDVADTHTGRLLDLLGALPRDCEAQFMALSHALPSARVVRHSGRCQGDSFPPSSAHILAHEALCQREALLTWDGTFPLLHNLSPGFRKRIALEGERADVVIASAPFVYATILEVPELRKKPLLHFSHRWEAPFHETVLSGSELGRAVAARVRELESGVTRRAAAVLVAHDRHRDELRDAYGLDPDRLRVVRRTVDSRLVLPPSQASRSEARRRLGLKEEERVACFLGGDEPGGVEAAAFIAGGLSPALRSWTFVVSGVSGFSPSPPNVLSIEIPDESSRRDVLWASDVVIDPVARQEAEGAVVQEAFAAGIPLVISPERAESCGEGAGWAFIVAEQGGFADALAVLASPQIRTRIGRAGRSLAETTFDSHQNALGFAGILYQLVAEGGPRPALPPPPLRLSVLTPYGRLDGISRDGESLVEGLSRSAEVRVLSDVRPDIPSDPRVWRCWSRDFVDPRDLDLVLSAHRPDWLLVHWVPAEWGWQALGRLARLCRRFGLPQAVLLRDPVIAVPEDSCLAEELSRIDRFFVESEEAAKGLRAAGVDRQAVAYIPSGVPALVRRNRAALRRKLGIDERFVIGHFALDGDPGELFALREFEKLVAVVPHALLLQTRRCGAADDGGVSPVPQIIALPDRERVLAMNAGADTETLGVLARSCDVVWDVSADGSPSWGARLAIAAERPVITPGGLASDPSRVRKLEVRMERFSRRRSWDTVAQLLARGLAPHRRRPAMQPFFTVVVPSYERPALLRELLERLRRQTFRDFEVVVVDQSARRWAEADRFAELPLRYVHSLVRGATHARNTGAWEARGRVLAFTDDDCLPDPWWLSSAAPYFSDPNVVGVEGFIRSEKRDDPAFRAVTNEGFEGIGFMTANLLVRREEFHRVGGFDEAFDNPHFREDTDLGWRLLLLGRIPFGRDVSVYHPPHRRDLEREGHEERGRFFERDALLLRKHPERYRKLFLAEGHYLSTPTFWPNFLRGVRKLGLKLDDFYRGLAPEAYLSRSEPTGFE